MTALLLTLLTALRIYFRLKTGSLFSRRVFHAERPLTYILRWLLGIPLLLAVAAMFVFPSRWNRMYLPLTPFVRWTGFVCACAALLLLLRVHLELGMNFDTTIGIHGEHRLVTTGPYARIRHPMYAAYLFFFPGIFLISGNWVIGISGLGVIVLLMTVRVRDEEAVLLERFGEEYVRYRSTVPRFIPKFRIYPKSFRDERRETGSRVSDGDE